MGKIRHLEMQQMTQLREQSQLISNILEQQITRYMQTLQPLFSPRRIVGEYMMGVEENKTPGAEQNFEVISKRYSSIMKESFNHSVKLSNSIPYLSHKLTLLPCSSIEEVDDLLLMIVSPTRWVISFETNYDHQKLIQHRLTKQEAPKLEEISQYVVAQLIMEKLISNNNGIAQLFDGLGYSLSIESLAPQIDIPLVVLNAPCVSFRPQSELIKMASQFAGSNVFTEFVEKEDVENMPNTLQQHILAGL